MLAPAIATIHRRDGGRILAGLIRRLDSFDIAEEALQDAYAAALARWQQDGAPTIPPRGPLSSQGGAVWIACGLPSGCIRTENSCSPN